MTKTCCIKNCAATAVARDLCQKHYMRLRRTGSAEGREGRLRADRMRDHPLYWTWVGMRRRCLNQSDRDYPNYGGRGVTICDRWLHGEAGIHPFVCFVADVGDRPEGFSLDRFPDADGPYAPDNVRWATPAEQRRNLSPSGDVAQRLSARDRYEQLLITRLGGSVNLKGNRRYIAKHLEEYDKRNGIDTKELTVMSRRRVG